MVFTKKVSVEAVARKLVFLFLVTIPFGVLARVIVKVGQNFIPIYALDVVALLSTVLWTLGFPKTGGILRLPFANFVLVSLFGLALSSIFFGLDKVFYGSLYLLRFVSYLGFYSLVKSLSKEESTKNLFLNSLITVGSLVAVFGFIQYFFFPDLRDLKYLGWDDHYYRMIGTFLDPGLLGLFLVLTSILVLGVVYSNPRKSKVPFLILIFLILAILLTYSRASYLAFIMSTLVLSIKLERIAKGLLICSLFLLAIPFLPRPAGEGVKLERVSSAFSRLNNYSETFQIIKKYPLLGVGFNNLCLAKISHGLAGTERQSHGCRGADSSLLFILSTTGVVGLITYLYSVLKIFRRIQGKVSLAVAYSVGAALLVHSLFLNSLFYFSILGWLAIFLAISQREAHG